MKLKKKKNTEQKYKKKTVKYMTFLWSLKIKTMIKKYIVIYIQKCKLKFSIQGVKFIFNF